MRYGFAIDQRTCIGCHACTVACKTEHEIPVGQFRTWVKYVDGGAYPDTTRDFAVLRCNHCTDAPCVKICPTEALFKRDDGIVDFDNERCIGCKACMQACPYDALYIDDETHTAAKCNYCAHRVDEGLEPACVVVCPTHSIWAGDLDDPDSGIARLVAGNATMVRAPEQNTGPNVFYVGADRATLDPLAAPVAESYLWSQPDEQRRAVSADLVGAEPDVAGPRTTANTAHPRPWGWRVTAYLWTKGVGSGALMVAAVAPLARADLGPTGRLVAPSVAVAGTAATGVLLVWDLKRPERFYYIFTKANRSSWLVWGSVALAGFATVAGGWLCVGAAEAAGLLSRTATDRLLALLRPAAVLGGAGAAGYTGLLFAQAEGRDLWQSPRLLPHLLVQAVMGGSGALLPAVALGAGDARAGRFLARTFVVSSAAHLALLGAEYGGEQHGSANAAAAVRLVTKGRYRRMFRRGAVGLGALAGALAVPAWNGRRLAAAAVGGLAAQAALVAYESVLVRAGQDVPLS